MNFTYSRTSSSVSRKGYIHLVAHSLREDIRHPLAHDYLSVIARQYLVDTWGLPIPDDRLYVKHYCDNCRECAMKLICNGKAPLLCLHGDPGSTHNYFEVLGNVADEDERMIVMYDQIGCGSSYLDGHPELWTKETWMSELIALREHLGLDECHIIGQSWGGMMIICFGIDYKEQTKGVNSYRPVPSSGYWTRKNMGKAVSGEKPELTGSPDKVLFLSLDKEIKKPDKTEILKEEPAPASDKTETERSAVIWDESRLDFLDTEERDKVLASASLIDAMEIDSYGEIIIDNKSKGTMDDPIHMPYVNYTEVVNQLWKAIYDFSK